MASSSVKNQVADPDYIKYLLDPKLKYDWYFVVGNGKNNTPVERIGVVKKMLLAHSKVFRRELDESPLKEKNDTEIKDIFPDTFKNLLRYVYGFNNIACLTFDEADDLLYVADKYMVEKLKSSLASRLMDLLSYENIFSLMNNRACYQVLELNSEITKIIQLETKKVLASPQFLDMSPEAFLTILQQEKLQVSEIELWRAALQWAKSRAKSDDGQELRKQLASHLPHIRVCAVSHENFCRDIVPTRVLTGSETIEICSFHGDKNYKPVLPELCGNTQPRTAMNSFIRSQLFTFDLCPSIFWQQCTCLFKEMSLNILTHQHRIELCSLVLVGNNVANGCTVKISQVSWFTLTPVLVSAQAHVPYPDNTINTLQLSTILLPNSEYKVTISSPSNNVLMNRFDNSSTSNNHLTVKNCELASKPDYYSCIRTIKYFTVTQ